MQTVDYLQSMQRIHIGKYGDISNRVGGSRQPHMSRSFTVRGHPYKENEWSLSSHRHKATGGHVSQNSTKFYSHTSFCKQNNLKELSLVNYNI